MLELAETALDIDENNVEDVEDFFRVRKMKGIAIDILKFEKGGIVYDSLGIYL